MSIKKSSFLHSSDSEEEEEEPRSGKNGIQNEFKINEDYAKSYNRFREKEVYQRLEAKYGKEAAEARLNNENEAFEDSSSDEDEDDEAEALTEEVEKDFFKTLASLKKKDPEIYDGKTEFFKAPITKVFRPNNVQNQKKEKLYIGDLERKVILEKGGKFEELEDKNLELKLESKTYVQEQEEIRENLKSQLVDDEEEEEGDEEANFGFLKKKKKTDKEAEEEKSDYKAWLAGQKKSEENLDNETKSSLKGLRDFWNQKNLDENEKFLKDYILNKRYLDHGSSNSKSEAGTSSQLVEDSQTSDDDENLSEDEKTLEKMEEFEYKFNFRFEEPDQDFIKRYPRTVQDSMRQEKNNRKKRREEVQKRKAAEKEQRKEELKQLKAMKRKEILEKLDKLKLVAGNSGMEFQDQDLEEDFDPDKYDKRMSEVFGTYDQIEVENESEKPDIGDLLDSDFEEELEMENWDEWKRSENDDEKQTDDQDLDAEDPDFNMDCDFENESEKHQREMIENSHKRKSKKRKSKFAEILEQKKPIFEPGKDKSFDKYLEEYYKLDYEDVVGGVPCRFKYRNVEQNDFGLSTEEILSAPDGELNSWCSLKKTCQYRTEEEEKADVRLFKSRGNNFHLKKKFLPSLFEEQEKHEEEEAEEEEEKSEKDNSKKNNKKKKKKNNKGKKRRIDGDVEGTTSKNQEISAAAKKQKRDNEVNAEVKMSDDRLKAYGINPKQLKRKVKKKKYQVKD